MEAALGIRLSPKAEYQIATLDLNFVSIKPLENKVYCAGQDLTLHLAKSGLFDIENTFSAELTNKDGVDFKNTPAIIFNDSLKIKLPENLEPWLNYRLRVHSSNPNVFSFPTQGIQVKSKGHIKLSTPNPMINLGDQAELKIEMSGNGPWNFSLSNGKSFENVRTPELSIYMKPENNASFKILAAQNDCLTEISASKVEIQVIQPNISIDESFITDLCKNQMVQIPIKGLNINQISEYKVVLEGTAKTFIVDPYVSALSLNFKLKIKGNGFGGFSLFKEVKIKSNPPQPKVISPIKYCYNTLPEKLNAEGSSLKWFYSANSNTFYNEVIPNTENEGLQFYYVSQTSNNGCESERSKIEVEV